MSTQARKQRETAHTVMLAGLVGSELMTTIGLTNRYQLFTPKHMLLDDDLSHRAANAFRDLELNDEALALDDDARRELRRIVGDADRELRG